MCAFTRSGTAESELGNMESYFDLTVKRCFCDFSHMLLWNHHHDPAVVAQSFEFWASTTLSTLSTLSMLSQEMLWRQSIGQMKPGWTYSSAGLQLWAHTHSHLSLQSPVSLRIKDLDWKQVLRTYKLHTESLWSELGTLSLLTTDSSSFLLNHFCCNPGYFDMKLYCMSFDSQFWEPASSGRWLQFLASPSWLQYLKPDTLGRNVLSWIIHELKVKRRKVWETSWRVAL